jgi:hypothetical protein
VTRRSVHQTRKYNSQHPKRSGHLCLRTCPPTQQIASRKRGYAFGPRNENWHFTIRRLPAAFDLK